MLAQRSSSPGQRKQAVQSKGPGVLINEGDGGGIGTAAQIAKWFGADVTGECSTVT